MFKTYFAEAFLDFIPLSVHRIVILQEIRKLKTEKT